ncbi:hypothetical protein ACIQJ4_23765 [Streptomyces filamentosus]|uniref:hypothetical protein n=1 Tax=Streptomyces filamentosus TaxID=67294 RepID=UPI0037F520C4
MSEHENPEAVGSVESGKSGESVEPVGSVEPVASAEPVVPVVPVEGVRSRRKAGRVLLGVVLPAVLVLGAAGGGIAYTAVTVANADRTAETVGWAPAGPEAAGEDPAENAVTRGRADTPMSKLLLPVPEGYRLGPDIDAYGNDAELTGQEATALLKGEARGLSGKKRRAYEKRIEKLGVQGIGLRSFTSYDGGLVVEVQIVRMKDKRGIHDLYQGKREITEFLELPEGPRIKDHRNSSCFLLEDPQDRTEDESKEEREERENALRGMSCSAYDSELLVSVTAFGAVPFEKSEVADLVKKQLDHIKSPGEYV